VHTHSDAPASGHAETPPQKLRPARHEAALRGPPTGEHESEGGRVGPPRLERAPAAASQRSRAIPVGPKSRDLAQLFD
jgi:hypothetical protein